MCILSPDFINSSVCAKEVAHAILYKKRLLPIVCRDVAPEKVDPELASLNWILMRSSENFDESFAKLLEALDTDLDYRHESTRLLVRACEWEQNGYNASFTLRGILSIRPKLRISKVVTLTASLARMARSSPRVGMMPRLSSGMWFSADNRPVSMRQAMCMALSSARMARLLHRLMGASMLSCGMLLGRNG